jgi:hypothetical protein
MNIVTPMLAQVAAANASTMEPVDWLMIALYFGILLCVATWVVRKSKDNATDYFLRGPQPGLVGHWRLHLRLEHRLGTHRGSRRLGREGWRRAGAL